MKISIITVSYNSAATIRDTLDSILSQDYPDIEHIIVDGGSTDETLTIVREFPHVFKIITEKDNGLYHAMNKGITIASGEIVGILNSDDVYAQSSVLSKVARRFSDENVNASYGDLQYVKATNTNQVVRTWKSGRFKPSDFYFGWMPPHPTFFVRRSVYTQLGLFNTSLITASDYELMLRVLFKNRFKAVYIPEILVKMRSGGLSNSSIRQRLAANKEDRIAWKTNELKPYFFTLYLKPLRKIFQFLMK
ncbi:MAG: glycosyltransferase family 2 protein [Chitinophagaceae bacterium]